MIKMKFFNPNDLDLEVVGKLSFSNADNRPFVSVDITSIAQKPIASNANVFEKIKVHIPTINATREQQSVDIKALLSAIKNPVGDSDKAHISLLYSFAFSRDGEIKKQQIKQAQQLIGTEVKLSISLNQFKVVTAAEALKDKKTDVATNAEFVEVPNLGPKRNIIVTIEMSDAAQEQLLAISRKILNNPTFPGNTDRTNTVQPYHMSVAQAQLRDDILLKPTHTPVV